MDVNFGAQAFLFDVNAYANMIQSHFKASFHQYRHDDEKESSTNHSLLIQELIHDYLVWSGYQDTSEAFLVDKKVQKPLDTMAYDLVHAIIQPSSKSLSILMRIDEVLEKYRGQCGLALVLRQAFKSEETIELGYIENEP